MRSLKTEQDLCQKGVTRANHSQHKQVPRLLVLSQTHHGENSTDSMKALQGGTMEKQQSAGFGL